MTADLSYRDGNALWKSVTARAQAEAQASGAAPGAILRRFVVDRFLARVFALPGHEWVLKGGNAVLARVHDARATKDVDLLAELSDLDAAVANLRKAVEIDLHDHFRFVVTGARAAGAGTAQPAVNGSKISIDAYCGVRRREHFSVDLVTGSLMTAEPDIRAGPGLVPAIPPAHVRLYPVVDHIADKLCATQSMYGVAGDRPSSRVRDLVDLVVFARTQHIDGAALIEAIAAEWAHRGLPGQPVFSPPTEWERLYPAEARRVPACGDVLTFSGAVELTTSLLAPACDRSALNRTWSPDASAWTGSAPIR
ncbi:nucleotidyl transferase AbiEii/AbiGii toxin family protein [Microbacterium sp. OVT16B]|uniref:nucleotidyl transferase AbiEii/AbiGii toxin family protein n=1 Tax=Microbacterium sp. OVT16B TaxID=2862682 RepID=UPI001CBC01A2|nr:nucleotidyl transferase AbiEii/AbiGii toxin family protein [Microbacterium sp. OVT16B]